MSLNAHGVRLDAESETLLAQTGGGFDVARLLQSEGFEATRSSQVFAPREVAQAITANYAKQPDNSDTALGPNLVVWSDIAHTLRGNGFDASEDGTGRGTPLVPVTAWPLTAGMAASASRMPQEQGALVPVAIPERAICENPNAGPDGAGFKQDGSGMGVGAIALPWAVRRLTPRECERLMGFPDDFTRIPYRGKPAEKCPDGPRYKALGNSWAVNSAAWIGERIQEVEGWE